MTKMCLMLTKQAFLISLLTKKMVLTKETWSGVQHSEEGITVFVGGNMDIS